MLALKLIQESLNENILKLFVTLNISFHCKCLYIYFSQKYKHQVEANIVHGINAVDDVMVPHLQSKIL